MNAYKIILLSLLSLPLLSQNFLTEEDVIGEWKASGIEAKSEGTRLMFGESVFTINADYSFTATLFTKVSGQWKIKDQTVILESSELPAEVILSGFSEGKCFWIEEDLEMKMTLIKQSE